MASVMYDLAIVGGGPAGAAAAVYAARKRLKSVFITEEWGGQSTVSTDIQNWIGSSSISGVDLAKNLKAHVEAYAGEFLEVRSPARAVALEPQTELVQVRLAQGGNKDVVLRARAVLITTGARRRTLDVPGAKEFDQKGLTYCASCDGPLFADKDVAVIGGGNAGFETALQLLAYCKTVTLLSRGVPRADEITVAAAKAHKNFRLIENVEPAEVLGERFVTGLKYKETGNGNETLLPVEGIFVEIGLLPNTEWVNGAVEMNALKQIQVDPRTQRTSHPRILAAGDVTDGTYHQNNIAAGDAVKALEDIYMQLRRS